MKPYVCLAAFCTLLFMLMPLGHLPKAEKTPSPKVSVPEEKAALTFLVLDEDSGEVSEWTERDFLIGTVSCEMSPDDPAEALKAQAVACYTYYSVERANARAAETPDASLKGADFSDVPTRFPEGYTEDGMKERWGKQYEKNYQAVATAVDAVLGERVLYEGEPIRALYHGISPGRTEDAKNVWGKAYPYLRSVPSTGDANAKDFKTTVTVTAEEFAKKVKSLGLSSKEDPAKWLGDTTKTDAGLVTGITVMGQTVTGAQLRRTFDLRSAFFILSYKDDKFTFTVLGHGHGVGMSQAGAVYLAEQGATYREILGYYYTDVTVE